MANLDTQVQIKLIEVASDLMNKRDIHDSGEAYIKRRTGYFDMAYKAMYNTVESQQSSEELRISRERRT